MKYLFLLLLFPCCVFGQQRELGLWIGVKQEAIDGTLIPTPGNFIKYHFLPDGTAELGTDVLFYVLKTSYTINDSLLTIGRVSYMIDKLSSDSLVIHENNPNLDAVKYRKYYFLRAGSTAPNKPVYNENIKDSVYTATKYFFPEYGGVSDLLKNKISDAGGKGELQVGFIISKDGKLVQFKIISNAGLSSNAVKRITKAFQSPENTWIPGNVNGVRVNTYMEMILRLGVFKNVGLSIHYPFAE